MSDNITICEIDIASRQNFERRFWSKTHESGNGCWEWTGSQMPRGYGRFAVARGQMRLAHRVAWELTHGPIPEDLCILHDCDNPACVNPAHLKIGSLQDNTQDMISKGRHAHGERHPKTDLTIEQVLAIRAMRANGGMSYRRIGRVFGIGAEAVYKIVSRKRWTHI